MGNKYETNLEHEKSYILRKLETGKAWHVCEYLTVRHEGYVQDLVEYITGKTQCANSKSTCFNDLLEWFYQLRFEKKISKENKNE